MSAKDFNILQIDREHGYELNVQLWSIPERDRLEVLTEEMKRIITTDNRACVWHFQHMKDAVPLLPPDFKSLIHIVSALLSIKDNISTNLKGTCINAGHSTDP